MGDGMKLTNIVLRQALYGSDEEIVAALDRLDP